MTRETPEERFDIIKYEDLSTENTWVKLGEGSFGNVYRAQYLGLPVAVKEIIPRLDYNVDKYFARECKILKEARHPNIVQYIGLCLAPPVSLGLNFVCNLDTQRQAEILDRQKISDVTLQNSRILIISEFVPKGTLRSYLQSFSNSSDPQPLTWRVRISFAIDIARAMAYLHERKCLHRDLKLDNCLLTENLRVKLCDFGFARFEAKSADEVRRLSYCGTDGYMSPEILRGDPFGLSTDVYSLGIIFCELISMKLAGACATIENQPGFLERVAPRYSMKSSDMRSLLQAEDGGCPKSFIELSLRCTQANCQLRPTVKEVLCVLNSIEQRIIDQERQKLARRNEPGSPKTIPSVGSLEFAKSNVKIAGRRSFRRMPSFLGQISIPKATNPDPRHSKRQEELLGKSQQALMFGSDSLLLDPKFHDPTNHLHFGQALQNFSTSTLRLDNTSGSLENASVSSLPSREVFSIPCCALPVEIPFKTQGTTFSSPSVLPAVEAFAERAFPSAIHQSMSSEFSSSQLGTIPTMNSQNGSMSTTKHSFQLAMDELNQAYMNERVSAPESGGDSKDFVINPEEKGPMSSQGDETCERKTISSQGTVTSDIQNDQVTSCLHNELPEQSLSSSRSGSVPIAIEHDTLPFSPLPSDSAIPNNIQIHAEHKIEDMTSILPHRFTMVRSNWLTVLLKLNNHLKESSSEASKSEKSCAGCKKFIGSTKSFLRCDDCGEKCHRKCGDSVHLSPCKR